MKERVNDLIVIIDQKDLSKQDRLTPAIIGFNSDTGVIRNNGRAGSVSGSAAIRGSLNKLALDNSLNSLQTNILDLGDIEVIQDDLELAQKDLGEVIANSHSNNVIPLVLGGGHETAYGHYLGLHQHYHDKNLLIINFDAHFDLRPLLDDGKGTSGTPFTQIAALRKTNFNYFVLGIQPSANTQSLFNTAKDLNTDYIYASEFIENINLIKEKLISKIDKHDFIYLSFCMDVFGQAFAPGVSAPQALGLSPYQVMPLLDIVLSSNKLIAMDIVELNPKYDIDNQTAKLAAQLTWSYYAKRFTCSN